MGYCLNFLSLVQQFCLLLREFVDVIRSAAFAAEFLRILLKLLAFVQQFCLLLREFVDVIRSAAFAAEFLRILPKLLSFVQQFRLLLREFVDVIRSAVICCGVFLGYCLNFCRSFSSFRLCCENLLR